MIAARATLNGDGILRQLRQAHLRALQRAVVFLWAELQRILNVPNTGVRVKRVRGRGSYTKYPNPSKPGEPPRKRTGWLQRNVVYSIDEGELSARVGLTENAEYGIDLELGTAVMAARPWLISTAKRLASRMAEIVRQELSHG